jgi:hypothetical protein
MEKVAPGRHSRNCGALASCRISALLLDLEGEKTGPQKKTGEGNPESDLPDGGRKPNLGAPRIHGELLMLGFDVSDRSISRWMKLSAQRPRTWPALAGLYS